jgi:hypothetical protein
VSSERCSIEVQPIEFVYGRVVFSDVVRGDLRYDSVGCFSIEHLSEGTRNAP